MVVFILHGECHFVILLELTFDDTFVKPYHLELYHKSIQEFYMIKISQRKLLLMCIVMVDSMLKALKHTLIEVLPAHKNTEFQI